MSRQVLLLSVVVVVLACLISPAFAAPACGNGGVCICNSNGLIDCGTNGLTTIPDYSTVLPNPKSIYMCCNPLSFIAANAFSGLLSISGSGTYFTELYLDKNAIIDISTIASWGLPANLQIMWLSTNRITTVPAMGGATSYPNLVTLKLDGNQITSISPTAFTGLTKLATLALNNNNLTTLPPGLFKGLLTTLSVDFTSNLFVGTPPSTFKDTSNVIRPCDPACSTCFGNTRSSSNCCPANCLSCTSATVCSTCYSGYSLVGSNCLYSAATASSASAGLASAASSASVASTSVASVATVASVAAASAASASTSVAAVAASSASSAAVVAASSASDAAAEAASSASSVAAVVASESRQSLDSIATVLAHQSSAASAASQASSASSAHAVETSLASAAYASAASAAAAASDSLPVWLPAAVVIPIAFIGILILILVVRALNRNNRKAAATAEIADQEVYDQIHPMTNVPPVLFHNPTFDPSQDSAHTQTYDHLVGRTEPSSAYASMMGSTTDTVPAAEPVYESSAPVYDDLSPNRPKKPENPEGSTNYANVDHSG
ncbi:hypothetical protein CAOG_08537 [Capsaspora owczarzaki ATCC 30864]|uniref:LRRNT domain-containing protein n=1 Tax=Capsaspora owczarzaki (strain ATCC 30864) TaxID=595528 RepID=A0A0D2U5C8_CAPO3|nr:hypothetical protein CAOG_08537 [Capsaspora owczarzaki ATCC 30864]KJE90351.1 hypothetical protein CAOG_008537 [Capsaspora owczarzaki ATCC 30864]|eukprot:XP_011270118.1 hypothetical protein CAOG_08537 [Capsaspora owczarzaki ATCC 30864]